MSVSAIQFQDIKPRLGYSTAQNKFLRLIDVGGLLPHHFEFVFEIILQHQGSYSIRQVKLNTF